MKVPYGGRKMVFPCFINPIALRKIKTAYNFDLSECNRVKVQITVYINSDPLGSVRSF